MRLQISIGMPNFGMPNFDSVNLCTTRGWPWYKNRNSAFRNSAFQSRFGVSCLRGSAVTSAMPPLRCETHMFYEICFFFHLFRKTYACQRYSTMYAYALLTHMHVIYSSGYPLINKKCCAAAFTTGVAITAGWYAAACLVPRLLLRHPPGPCTLDPVSYTINTSFIYH